MYGGGGGGLLWGFQTPPFRPPPPRIFSLTGVREVSRVRGYQIALPHVWEIDTTVLSKKKKASDSQLKSLKVCLPFSEIWTQSKVVIKFYEALCIGSILILRVQNWQATAKGQVYDQNIL